MLATSPQALAVNALSVLKKNQEVAISAVLQSLHELLYVQTSVREIEKLPNELHIGCYIINTQPVKVAIERQMKELREELLASLRRKVHHCALTSLHICIQTLCLHFLSKRESMQTPVADLPHRILQSFAYHLLCQASYAISC